MGSCRRGTYYAAPVLVSYPLSPQIKAEGSPISAVCDSIMPVRVLIPSLTFIPFSLLRSQGSHRLAELPLLQVRKVWLRFQKPNCCMRLLQNQLHQGLVGVSSLRYGSQAQDELSDAHLGCFNGIGAGRILGTSKDPSLGMMKEEKWWQGALA